MVNQTIAPHETFEVHELLTFKNVCATKSATMATMASDPELKSMLQQDFSLSQGQIREPAGLLQQSTLKEWTGGTARAGINTVQ